MNEIIEAYLNEVNNLSMLEPKNLPIHILHAMSEMESGELFKVCTQLYILKNNIPTENKIVNLTQEEILKGATTYAKEILQNIKQQ